MIWPNRFALSFLIVLCIQSAYALEQNNFPWSNKADTNAFLQAFMKAASESETFSANQLDDMLMMSNSIKNAIDKIGEDITPQKLKTLNMLFASAVAEIAVAEGKDIEENMKALISSLQSAFYQTTGVVNIKFINELRNLFSVVTKPSIKEISSNSVENIKYSPVSSLITDISASNANAKKPSIAFNKQQPVSQQYSSSEPLITETKQVPYLSRQQSSKNETVSYKPGEAVLSSVDSPKTVEGEYGSKSAPSGRFGKESLRLNVSEQDTQSTVKQHDAEMSIMEEQRQEEIRTTSDKRKHVQSYYGEREYDQGDSRTATTLEKIRPKDYVLGHYDQDEMEQDEAISTSKGQWGYRFIDQDEAGSVEDSEQRSYEQKRNKQDRIEKFMDAYTGSIQSGKTAYRQGNLNSEIISQSAKTADLGDYQQDNDGQNGIEAGEYFQNSTGTTITAEFDQGEYVQNKGKQSELNTVSATERYDRREYEPSGTRWAVVNIEEFPLEANELNDNSKTGIQQKEPISLLGTTVVVPDQSNYEKIKVGSAAVFDETSGQVRYRVDDLRQSGTNSIATNILVSGRDSDDGETSLPILTALREGEKGFYYPNGTRLVTKEDAKEKFPDISNSMATSVKDLPKKFAPDLYRKIIFKSEPTADEPENKYDKKCHLLSSVKSSASTASTLASFLTKTGISSYESTLSNASINAATISDIIRNAASQIKASNPGYSSCDVHVQALLELAFALVRMIRSSDLGTVNSGSSD